MEGVREEERWWVDACIEAVFVHEAGGPLPMPEWRRSNTCCCCASMLSRPAAAAAAAAAESPETLRLIGAPKGAATALIEAVEE